MSRESINYFRQGDAIEVKHIVNGKVIDTRGFRLNNPSDNNKFFEYALEKLGFNYKKYHREKISEWQ